ncbi:MAG: polysaccharide pyruvyl transferase family protein [Actinobacteria bacterium]|nr:polysaccharide pyruvyl transferase family protein [Actinomycetota bacterium]
MGKELNTSRDRSRRIFLAGLTSGKLGGMEYHNLGNYVIMEPLIKLMREEFPNSDIITSIQMSDEFCKTFDIVSKRDERFFTYGLKTALTTLADIAKLTAWAIFKYVTRLDLGVLVRSSKLLNEIYRADIVIDFSGDLFGDNSKFNAFLEACAELLFAKVLGKPTAMIIGSPGPFRSTWRFVLAKFVMQRIDLITTREPLSKDFLEYIGIRDNVTSTACPSFLFEKKRETEVEEDLKFEGLLDQKDKPLVGLILCGWNMREGPFNKWPREDTEYVPFIELINYLIDNLNVRVCIMSHQNATNGDGEIVTGNDHRIINQLMSSIQGKYSAKEVFTLKGIYDAAASKTIIGQFDMLISGRVHGAVQGLSQYIPTAIINYGHEPKAHKLRGFAKLADIEQYVCDPNSSSDMINKVDALWKAREFVKRHLELQAPKIQELARENFKLMRFFLNVK